MLNVRRDHLMPTVLMALLLLLLSVSNSLKAGQLAAAVDISTIPPIVYTSVQETDLDAPGKPPALRRATNNLTWMFHLAFESNAQTRLAIEKVEVNFTKNGTALWTEVYSRSNLEGMEWIEGRYRLTTDYFLDRVMFGSEQPTSPDLMPGETISWVRIPFSRPRFAEADQARFTFKLRDESNDIKTVTHVVELHSRQQKNTFRLPFDGTWLVVKGNHLDTVSHRWTGINGLTTFGWDFMKLGPGYALYEGAGRAAQDRYSYGASALAAADGRVVHVRNDIPDYEGSPPREVLEEDGDVFAGNLVVIDHGGEEYTLTCHLLPGSVQVEIGDQVKAGDVLGRVGEMGVMHFNVMNKDQWLEADGLPAVFSDFERILPPGEPRPIDRGNPVTGWMVRSDRETDSKSTGANRLDRTNKPYYPPASSPDWARRSPASQGMDPDRLDEAIAYAWRQDAEIPHSVPEAMPERVADEGHGGIIGPLKERGDFNGLVIRNGYIVKEFGNTHRVDMAFSATKSFLAIVAGLAVDHGLIEDVTDPVGRYVNDGNFSSPHNARVTWEHLLHMRSEWDGELFGKPYTVEIPEGHELQEPGSVWIHNDVRVNLLALSLARVWQESLPVILKDYVMDPIGASDEWTWHGYRNSDVEINGRTIKSVSGGGHWGGGLFISARDLARVGYLLLRDGKWGERQILSPEWLDATLTPTSVESPYGPYGYLTWLNTDGKQWPSAPHSSFAFRGHGSNIVWVDPEHDLVLVLRWVEWDKLDEILERLLAAIETSTP